MSWLPQNWKGPPNLKGYVLWWTDFATEFQQGMIRGGLPGIGAGGTTGGAAAATGAAPDVSSIAIVSVASFVSMVFWNGYTNAAVWARQNPLPNPFRRPSNQMEIPIK